MNNIVNSLVGSLVSAVGALLLVSAHCATAGELRVEGLDSEYTGTDHIVFTIVNLGDAPVFVAVAVESSIEGAWREVTYAISKKDPVKGTMLTEISPGARVVRIWDSAELPIEPGDYRLRLELRDPEKRDAVAVDYSRVFRITGTSKVPRARRVRRLQPS
jgi:hypothetical protein